jgi:hypothetical protein
MAGGFFAVPWVFKADLDYFAKTLHPEHYGSHSPCALCRADRDQRPWTDFRPDSAWKETLWDETAWRVHDPEPPRLFRLLTCGIHTVQVDTLHSLSLGVAQHVGDNILRQLVYTVLNTGPLQVQRYYREQRVPTQVSKLTMAMFLHKGSPHRHYPELKTKKKET